MIACREPSLCYLQGQVFSSINSMVRLTDRCSEFIPSFIVPSFTYHYPDTGTFRYQFFQFFSAQSFSEERSDKPWWTAQFNNVLVVYQVFFRTAVLIFGCAAHQILYIREYDLCHDLIGNWYWMGCVQLFDIQKSFYCAIAGFNIPSFYMINWISFPLIFALMCLTILCYWIHLIKKS